MLLYVCCQGWPFSIEYIISALFPGEEFFSHSQNFLVACYSVCRVESSWGFSFYFGDIHVQLMFTQWYWWEFMHGSFFFFFAVPKLFLNLKCFQCGTWWRGTVGLCSTLNHLERIQAVEEPVLMFSFTVWLVNEGGCWPKYPCLPWSLTHGCFHFLGFMGKSAKRTIPNVKVIQTH